MKYLITKTNKVKVFPENISHHTKGTKSNTKSAGYFRIRNGKVETYDKSHSLNIKPKQGDHKLIEKKLK